MNIWAPRALQSLRIETILASARSGRLYKHNQYYYSLNNLAVGDFTQYRVWPIINLRYCTYRQKRRVTWMPARGYPGYAWQVLNPDLLPRR